MSELRYSKIEIVEGQCPLCRQKLPVDDSGTLYDRRTRIAVCGGHAVSLGYVEGEIFHTLWKNWLNAVSYDKLIFEVYGQVYEADRPESPKCVIQTCSYTLRHKLEDARLPLRITTIRGLGFLMGPA